MNGAASGHRHHTERNYRRVKDNVPEEVRLKVVVASSREARGHALLKAQHRRLTARAAVLWGLVTMAHR